VVCFPQVSRPNPCKRNPHANDFISHHISEFLDEIPVSKAIDTRNPPPNHIVVAIPERSLVTISPRVWRRLRNQTQSVALTRKHSADLTEKESVGYSCDIHFESGKFLKRGIILEHIEYKRTTLAGDGSGSSVGIATGYGLDGPGIELAASVV
jgi:hypothetical protein